MLNSVLSASATLSQLLMCIGCAAVLGFINMLIFRFRSTSSRSLSLTLVLLPVAITVVVMLVNGNVGLGLVTAGVFTMARFRSMQGTAREICSLFMAIAIGLACGPAVWRLALSWWPPLRCWWCCSPCAACVSVPPPSAC